MDKVLIVSKIKVSVIGELPIVYPSKVIENVLLKFKLFVLYFFNLEVVLISSSLF